MRRTIEYKERSVTNICRVRKRGRRWYQIFRNIYIAFNLWKYPSYWSNISIFLSTFFI